MKFVKSAVVSAALPLMLAGVAKGGLVGSSVTGSLVFGGGSANYYDPSNGYVAAGNLNTAGPTVIISATATEFGFADASNTDTANFTDSSLTVADNHTAGTANNWTMTFTDPVFSGLSLTKIDDDFPSGGTTASLSGDVLAVTWPGGTGTGAFTADFSTAVPEPASLTLIVAAGALLMRRRRSTIV